MRAAVIIIALACVGGSLVPRPATAQVRSFERLEEHIEPGDHVYVTRSSGAETAGVLVDLSSTGLTLRVDTAYHDFAEQEVRRIDALDSLLNGMMIGLGGGLGVSVLSIERRWVDEDDQVTAVLLGGGIGLGVGTAIDAAIRRRDLVYLARDRISTGLALAPIISRTRKGAAVSFRF